MKKYKKFLSATLCAAMAVSLLAGCSGGSASSGSGSSGTSSDGKGRYVENDLGDVFNSADSASSETDTAAEDESEIEVVEASYVDTTISSFTTLKDGSLRAVVTTSDGSYKIYSSDDNGKSWKDLGVDFSKIGGLGYTSNDDATDYTSSYISNISMDGEGNAFLIYDVSSSTATGSSETVTYYVMSSDGEFTEADFEIPGIEKTTEYDYSEDVVSDTDAATEETDDGIIISEDGDISIDDSSSDDYASMSDDTTYSYVASVKLVDSEHLYVATDSTVYLVNLKTNKVEQEITDLEYVSNLAVCGDKLVAVSYDKTYVYDAATGKKSGELDGFSEIMSSARSSLVIADSYDGSDMYYVDSDGLFKYNIESNENTMIIDGALTSLVDSSLYVNAIAACSDGSYLIGFTGNNGQQLCSYVYDPDMASKPDKQITIYTLTDNYTLRQVASGFQKANPDVYVTYEIGMTGDDAVTTSDAMRTLNTEIMAGEGPDVILLDGLSVDDYIDKGVLADISDIIQPMIDDGKLFANQASAYKQKDGSISAIPMTFTYPMLIGDKDVIDNISTISDLADAAEEFAASNKNDNVTFMESFALSSLLMGFLPVCTNWYSDNGSLNTDELKSDLENLKRLYDACYNALGEDDQSSVDSMMEYYTSEDTDDFEVSSGGWVSDPSSDAMYITGGVYKVALGYMSTADNLQVITSSMRADKNLTYTSYPGTNGNVYVPANIIGLNAKSDNTDTAKEFLNYLLSDDGQDAYAQQYSGFPISISAFDKSLVDPNLGEDWYDPKEPSSSMGMTDADGNDYELDLYWPSDDEIAEFKEKISSLDTPSSKNETVMNTIFKDCIGYIAGTTSLDDSLEQVQKDIKIYLSE